MILLEYTYLSILMPAVAPRYIGVCACASDGIRAEAASLIQSRIEGPASRGLDEKLERGTVREKRNRLFKAGS